LPYTTLVAGTSILASWANASVRDQVVTPFATTSARSSAVSSPVEGMVSAITDDNRIEVYDGSAYQRIAHYAASGRTQVQLRRAANQSMTNSTYTSVSWDTEDSDADGFITATSSTLTVPSGLGGWYIMEFNATAQASATYTDLGVRLVKTGSNVAVWPFYGISYTPNIGDSLVQAHWSGPLAASDTIVWQLFQTSGADRNATFSLSMLRVAI